MEFKRNRFLPEYTLPSSLPNTKLLISFFGNAILVIAIDFDCLSTEKKNKKNYKNDRKIEEILTYLYCNSKISCGTDNISKLQEHNLPSDEIEMTLCAFCVPTIPKQ